MTQSTIEIEGFPEGWKAVSYRCPESGDYYLENNGIVIKHTGCKQKFPWIIVEKIQPRRIVPDSETQIALMEGAMNSAADDYFAARPQLDNTHNLRIFEAGFRRAWKEVKE